jgi:hypothetical protein
VTAIILDLVDQVTIYVRHDCVAARDDSLSVIIAKMLGGKPIPAPVSLTFHKKNVWTVFNVLIEMERWTLKIQYRKCRYRH